ncbi:hypothetical protein CIL05_07805 [Virgibacillus profundi]|uniref:Uncharacterized protein n=1 Tax=Virgibacillus profundi TaxID=2024555 RepID=A0A2A2IFD1_9BACI|nr:hypothetical protein [Virgibacillus profundi]PAV30367.1 hypothetical protein CIL05_07805 [Virgibacillus profundi]PXY54539.1 hypothetical protein CIT14_07890 [Virgibacillus profundi]
MLPIDTLLEIHNDDFELWKEEKYGVKFYHVSIEGYIGFEKLEDFIELYEHFLGELQQYLIENNYPKTEKSGWKRIYSKRAMDICYGNDCYWIFLDGYESAEIWDAYYYLEDVINQLREVKASI